MSGPVTNEEILAYLVDLSANIANQFATVEALQSEYFISLRNILNLEVIPELNDLSANIAADFALVNEKLLVLYDYSVTIDTGVVTGNNKIGGVSEQVTGVLDYLTSEINAGIILNTEQLSSVIIQGDIIQGQITDLSANLTAQNKDLILMIAEETGQVLNSISNQTNDINTNTNTALSQYTNTINTNTNASVSTAVSILNK